MTAKNDKELNFCIKHNIIVPPKCKFCDNKASFYKNRYNITCGSYQCRKQLANETCKNRYGNKNYNGDRNIATKKRLLNISEIVSKTKQTKLERYNDENYNNVEQSKQTCLGRYGSTTYLSSEHGREVLSYISTTEEYIEKRKQTCLLKYGTTYYFQSDVFKENIKQQNLEKYGVTYYFQSDVFKENIRQQNLEKHGVTYYFQSNEFKGKRKQTCLEQFGTDNLNNVYNIQQKRYKTMKENNSFSHSKMEDYYYSYLTSIYGNVIRQYRDERYPFNCDFYVPSKDLFIEYNLHWTHGGKPFEGTLDDLLKLQDWCEKNTKYYDNAIYTWTDLDVRKQNIAKKNKLNYICIY